MEAFNQSEGSSQKPQRGTGRRFQLDIESRRGTPTIASVAIEPKAMQTASPEKASKSMLSSDGRRAQEEGASQEDTESKHTYSQHSGTGSVPQLQGLTPMAQIRQINCWVKFPISKLGMEISHHIFTTLEGPPPSRFVLGSPLSG